MSFIIKNNKISKILFIITISIILLSISLNVKAAENKIEIKDGNQIITDTTGTLKTPKVLNVNTNVEKKLTINYVGVDNNRLDYNLEEKEGNLDFDVNVLTGEIKLKAKSGTNFGAVFSLVDRQTKKVYPISLVIRAIDGKSKVSLLGSVKNMKFNTISGNMYLEGIADLKRVIEGGINPLNEKPTMYLKNLNTQRTVELSVEKVSTYEYRFRIKAEDMAEDDKYIIYAKIAKQNTYADNSSLERQLTIERAVPNAIENNRYKLTNSDDNISIKTKPVIYNLNANLVDMYGFHRGQNDYVIGTADIFLKDNDENRVKPREVKIYAEKNGNKTYFNVYNNRYDFELLLNNVEAGEYTIYAEAIGNNGKTYKEKLNISQGLRKSLTVSGMQTESRTGESKLVLTKKNKEKEPNYIIRTNTNSMYGFHRADGNDYIIGTADIFLSDENGNRVKPREVKIYAEKDGNKTYFNVYNDRYDFELLLNNVEAGEYTIYAEATGNNGKIYREKLWIGGHLRKNITISGMQTETKVEEGKIVFKSLKQQSKPEPKEKLDKTNLNKKLKEVEELVKDKELTENLKKDKTEESIRKYTEEYNKVLSNLNSVKVNISKLGEDKTSENESKLNQYIKDLDNIKNSLSVLNNILKVKEQPKPKLDKTILNNKLREVENLIKIKALIDGLKNNKTADSIKKYQDEYNKIMLRTNNVKVNILKLGEYKTQENENNLNQYINELDNIKNSLNGLNSILKIKLDKTNLNYKSKEVEELIKNKKLTEDKKKGKTEDSINEYNTKLNEQISKFNNVSSIKLFQNSPYGEAWVTILENIPTNFNDYFIKIESNNHRPIIIGVNKIEKVGNKYKIYGDNIEYILGENDLKTKDITKIKGYQNDKSNIYNNIIKLIPYYNLETVIEIGNKVNNSSVLNNKKINSIIPLKDKEVSSSEEIRNGLSNKVMIKFDDNTVEYYNLENLGKFKQFKEYNINLNGEKILYTPELGIENSKTKEVVNEIKQQFEKVNFLEDKKIFEILNPRIKALDKIKKRNEMKKQLGREVSDEELLKELQKITLEKMSYKNSFDNIQKNIDDILNTLLINNQNIITNNMSLEKVKKKLIDNKEKVLLGLTYIDRLYNLKYSNINLKNLIIYYPEFFGKKVDIIEFLIMVGDMQYLEYKLDATPATFRKKFNYIFKEQTIPEFLENMKNIFEPKLSINDWFKKASNAYIEEQKSEYNNNLEYQIFNKLKKDSEQKYLLPLLNVSENSIYAITTVTTTTFGIVDAYVDRDGTQVEKEKQLREFKEKLRETAKRQATFLDFWFRISNKDTHHNLISNRIVMDSLRIFNKNPYVNARDTWSKEYGTQASKGVSEFVAPFDFYREFFVADGEANGLRSKYVPCESFRK